MKKIEELSQPGQAKSYLWELAREGARKMIQAALEAEQKEFLEHHDHLLIEKGHKRFVRNGALPERNLKMPAGDIPIVAPRVRDRAKGSDDIQFSSSILPKYLRKTKELDELIPFLYLKGISTNDFSEVMGQLLGHDVSLSVATVVRLKKIWHTEFEQWNKRDLSNKKYVYWWADGIYVNLRMDKEKTCILVLMGATEDGKKELLGIESGYRESSLSWQELFLSLKNRNLISGPKLAIGDGALGFWKALRQEYPTTREQRCWVHKTANILDKMPKSIHASAKSKIHEIYLSDTQSRARTSFDNFVKLYEDKYPKAVMCLQKSKEESLAFYDFPAESWAHIRTTNPIESTFATIRLRTKRTKGSCNSREALCMVFKLAQAAQKRWRKLRGFNKLTLVMGGSKFNDGVLEDAA